MWHKLLCNCFMKLVTSSSDTKPLAKSWVKRGIVAQFCINRRKFFQQIPNFKQLSMEWRNHFLITLVSSILYETKGVIFRYQGWQQKKTSLPNHSWWQIVRVEDSIFAWFCLEGRNRIPKLWFFTLCGSFLTRKKKNYQKRIVLSQVNRFLNISKII